MLAELHVSNLGVIDDLTLQFGAGMTALTGETGAGKTLVIEAIELLLGERADPMLVRSGAAETRVEGRFVSGATHDAASPATAPATEDVDQEVVLARVVPSSGRSRAYIDGRLATVAELLARGDALVDLHSQHAHQSLLRPDSARAALDRFARVDTSALGIAKARLARAHSDLAALGGDELTRQRETDLLRFEAAELAAAAVVDAEEGERLEAEEERLATTATTRSCGELALAALRDDGGASDSLARAARLLADLSGFSDLQPRLRAMGVEMEEMAGDLRRVIDAIVEDPERLDAVRQRQRVLGDLCRRYATSSGGPRPAALGEVLVRLSNTVARLAELEHHGERVAEVELERAAAANEVAEESVCLGVARRAAAPRLAEAVEAHLRTLALPKARFEVAFTDGDVAGEHVTFLLSTNVGQPALPLAKVASGGELARTMLAARLVLTDSVDTLIFDEVDAGVGGEAALAVGRALAELSTRYQVLVVTHLPQVAAFADRQVAVTKYEKEGHTIAAARVLNDDERVVELSRMMSGRSQSATARVHAEELLASASLSRHPMGGVG